VRETPRNFMCLIDWFHPHLRTTPSGTITSGLTSPANN
jgi:hypothetical protein